MKHCWSCGTDKPLGAFARNRGAKDGRQSSCRVCQSTRSRAKTAAARALRPPVVIPAGQTCVKCEEYKPLTDFYKRDSGKYGVRAECKECSKAAVKANAEKDKEKVWKRNKKYRENNEAKVKAAKVAYTASFPEVGALNTGKVRVEAAGNDVRLIRVQEARALLQGPCMACGSMDDVELDHIIPVSRGGRHSIGNLTALCSFCNMSKHTRTWMEWRIWKIRRDREYEEIVKMRGDGMTYKSIGDILGFCEQTTINRFNRVGVVNA